MGQALAESQTPGTFGVLDARRGKLYTIHSPPGLGALLQGEAASFAAIHADL